MPPAILPSNISQPLSVLLIITFPSRVVYYFFWVSTRSFCSWFVTITIKEKKAFKSQVSTLMNCVDPKVNNGSTADVGSKRKTVRIASEHQVMNCVDYLGEMSDQERFHGWWQADEYEGTKADARTQCRKMRRLGDAEGPLSEAYERACSIATTSQTDLGAMHSAQVLTPDEVCLYFHESLCNIVVVQQLTYTIPNIVIHTLLLPGSRSLV